MSAVENVQAALARIERDNARVNAFTAVLAERALARAAKVAPDAPLAGLVFAAKNLFDIAGIPTTAGSKIRKSAAPAAEDCILIRRLEAAGAVCVGALNMDEFAYGFTTENSHDGACHNPHDLTRIAGGSSGGSGAAVAAGMVEASLGTDTNGSIRVPSSLNGIFGIKPTYGRLPRTGSVPFVASLDHVGPFARSATRLAEIYDVLQGPDPMDSCQLAKGVDPVLPGLGGGIAGLNIAKLGGWFEGPMTDAARGAVASVAQALGATATVSWSMAEAVRAAAFLITSSEGGALHLPELRTQYEDFEPLTQDRLLAGSLLPAAWVNHAQRVRAAGRDAMAAIQREFDILIAPATPTVATPIGQEELVLDGVRMPLRPSMGLYTQPISGIGLPVVTVPIQNAEGAMPIGVQLIGRPWQEDVLFRAARVLEQAGLCSAPVAPAFAS
ncbi:AtzE family amidohydrolase [Rhodovarius crocodyli]|uniref:AtzE family amidohydrolase n=1 Tax=Rhodovarius crocodyli TaxID=1979269 RepID=A0A437M3X4_9PROT|nr:AtzE family amidohydrolase [Rhodovarius crocodyli]RVT92265.1 AtzE family amidohydrolase [Rhodovarius crocodyli]